MEKMGRDKIKDYSHGERIEGFESAIRKTKQDIEDYRRGNKDNPDIVTLEEHLKGLEEQLKRERGGN